MIWIGIVWIVGLLAFMYALAVAPEGYEDETGFHYGVPDDGE